MALLKLSWYDTWRQVQKGGKDIRMTAASLTTVREVPNRSISADLPIHRHLVVWFSAVHFLGLVVAPAYLVFVQFSWQTLLMAFVLRSVSLLAIRAGVHTLTCHNGFKAVWIYEAWVMLFFSAAFQYSALVWAYFHRLHHAYEDGPKDPYSVKHGFWWAHFFWILRTVTDENTFEERYVRDLKQNKLVMWQKKYNYRLAFLMGLALPTALGSLWGDAWGGLLVGGFLGLMVQSHCTWSVNSIAHTYGKSRYVPSDTARSNLLIALPTAGEGRAHDRHHLAEEDPIIDPRPWSLDVGKYFIYFCEFVGLIKRGSLRRVPEEEVWRRARLKIARRAQA